MGIQLHSLLALALNGRGWLPWCPGCLVPWKDTDTNTGGGGWWDRLVSQPVCRMWRRKICYVYRDSNLGPPSPQPRQNTNHATQSLDDKTCICWFKCDILHDNLTDSQSTVSIFFRRVHENCEKRLLASSSLSGRLSVCRLVYTYVRPSVRRHGTA
jgi:hypothetical protein